MPEADRQALIEYLQSHYDGLRAIIHNASLWLDDGLDNLQTMFRLHVEAPYHLNLALGDLLGKVEKADIIHICDETSSRGSKSHIGYAATKPRCRTWCCRSPKNTRRRCASTVSCRAC